MGALEHSFRLLLNLFYIYTLIRGFFKEGIRGRLRKIKNKWSIPTKREAGERVCLGGNLAGVGPTVFDLPVLILNCPL